MYRPTLGVVTDTEYVVLTPGVVSPDEWPVIKTVHVFNNVRLDPGVLKEVVKSRQKVVDTAVVLGAQIEYSVKLESSILTGCTAWFLWNNEVVDTKGFALWESIGTIKSGSILIPKDKILATNILTIGLTHVPATFNQCLFNVHVTFGYSQEPSKDPPWDEVDEQPDWIKWLLLGGGALLLVYLFVGRKPSVIVVKG